jgi:hypothetical protein
VAKVGKTSELQAYNYSSLCFWGVVARNWWRKLEMYNTGDSTVSHKGLRCSLKHKLKDHKWKGKKKKYKALCLLTLAQQIAVLVQKLTVDQLVNQSPAILPIF